MQSFDPITGVTTSEYVVAATLDHSLGAVLLIRNTHATATMYYKISIYFADTDSALEHAFVAQTDLAAETTIDPVIITFPFAKMTVSVKQHSGAGTYQIDRMVY